MTELQQKILELRDAGKSYTEIQSTLGCSKGTISYFVGLGVKDRQHRRQRVSRNKLRVVLQEIKQKTPCADCRENYPYWVMDFDHLSDKSFNLAAFAREKGAKLDTILAEVAKCEVVCSNCHRTRTHNRNLKSVSKDVLDVEEYYT